MDPLLVTEAWDYLRDTLLLLVNGHLETCCGQLSHPGAIEFSESDGPFPESMAKNGTTSIANTTEKICTALATMLRRCDTVAGTAPLQSLCINSLGCGN